MSSKTIGDDGSARLLGIGELAEIGGTTVSALRHYERVGVLVAERSSGNHRLYRRDAVLRLIFILTERSYGISLDVIRRRLGSLPHRRTPTVQEKDRFVSEWRAIVCDRIRNLSCPDDVAVNG